MKRCFRLCRARFFLAFTLTLIGSAYPVLASHPSANPTFTSLPNFSPTAAADHLRAPQLNPPKVDLGRALKDFIPDEPSAETPATEWMLHKTADGAHPDGNEQQLIWLMNRARHDPTAEGIWLATVDDPDIANARSYFSVDLVVLQNEFAGYDSKPPAAFDVRLYEAAKAHSDDLILRDAQDHDGQFDRIQAVGFVFNAARGCVFSYSQNASYGHAAFNIDWGWDEDGMQTGRGHRMAIMSIDGDYTNVGIAAVREADSSTSVGPWVITGNYCNARTSVTDHYNRFLVGTVWTDSNGNSMFDPTEGISGVTVRPDHGTYYAVTSNSGGYAIPLLASGEYQVSFSGSSLPSEIVQGITVGAASVLLDLLVGSSAGEPQALTGSATGISSTSATVHGTVNPDGESTTYYFEYGTTAGYGLQTTGQSVAVDSEVSAAIAGLSPETTYHYRIVATNSYGTARGADKTFTTWPTYESTTEPLITEYYHDILDRGPDTLGLAGWQAAIDRIVALEIDIKEGFIALAKFFFNSEEYINQEKSAQQYVTDLYQTFLNREPDQAGLDYWVGLLAQGLSRNVVLNYFVYSDEFTLYMADQFDSFTSKPECNLVNDLYRGLQGRLPDSEGFNSWVGLMREAMSEGEQAVRNLAHQIAVGFMQSEEYALRDRSDREFLEDLYNGILRRGAQPEEIDGWLVSIHGGMTRSEVLHAFTNSPEFQPRVQQISAASVMP
ncbi:MAG: DUF4214 domain-containing protein [Desulfobacterales bacterium]|nr:MAG: DUF4214 domain-containing protein [Desulfobacterales bacterium]